MAQKKVFVTDEGTDLLFRSTTCIKVKQRQKKWSYTVTTFSAAKEETNITLK